VRADEDVQDQVGEPERTPGAVRERRDRITRLVGPHPGKELGQAAEHRGKRRERERRLRRPPPAGEVRGDDEGRTRETRESEDRRRGDRL
jgi:hypothetical protein